MSANNRKLNVFEFGNEYEMKTRKISGEIEQMEENLARSM